MENCLVDIVIVNFNTQGYLRDCLESIRKHSGPEQGYRVYVVDNGSSDGSVQLIRSFDWVKGIFNRKNRGYGAGCNQGIKLGTGAYIILMNSDTLALPNWLPPLVASLRDNSSVAVVGPRLVDLTGRIVGAGVVGTNAHPILRGWQESNQPEKYDKVIECLSVCGACFGIKRSLLSKLGFFDEHYFHYFEETDYAYNARYHGYKVIYTPDSNVIHRVFGSCGNHGLLKKYFRDSEAFFQKKWRMFFKDETEYG